MHPHSLSNHSLHRGRILETFEDNQRAGLIPASVLRSLVSVVGGSFIMLLMWRGWCFPRALKTRGNTPKYGLIFHSTFIGRAAAKNKGRISRYLANKCTIASRIDCFSGERRRSVGSCSRRRHCSDAHIFRQQHSSFQVDVEELFFWAKPQLWRCKLYCFVSILTLRFFCLVFRITHKCFWRQAARASGGASVFLWDWRGASEKRGCHEGSSERGKFGSSTSEERQFSVVNDEKSFPDVTVRVKTDLMSLTQHERIRREAGCFSLLVLVTSPSLQATDVASEIKRKLEKKEKKRLKRERKLKKLEANGEANGDAEVTF